MGVDLLAEARNDWRRFTQADFGIELTFTATDNTVAIVRGLASNHHYGVDPETGAPVNSKNSHCSVSEQLLTDAGYPVRDITQIVDMRRHNVAYKDSTGLVKTYLIDSCMPSETTGMLVFTLGSYE